MAAVGPGPPGRPRGARAGASTCKHTRDLKTDTVVFPVPPFPSSPLSPGADALAVEGERGRGGGRAAPSAVAGSFRVPASGMAGGRVPNRHSRGRAWWPRTWERDERMSCRGFCGRENGSRGRRGAEVIRGGGVGESGWEIRLH